MITRVLILFMSALLLIMPQWIHRIFGQWVSTEQIIFHVLSGLSGLEGSDSTIITSFIWWNLLIPAFITLGLLISLSLFRRLLSYVDSSISLNNFKNLPLLQQLIKIIVCSCHLLLKTISSIFFSLLLFTLSAIFFYKSLGVGDYIKTFTGRDTFSHFYVEPSNLKLTPSSNNKNVILIYFESLEYSLRDQRIFGENLISPIDKLPGVNLNILAAPGTTWSLAGMISSQCSIPVKGTSGFSSYAASSYLPNLICLGDILNLRGYNSYFLVGPELEFSGMDKYYKGHGYQNTYGLNEWKKLGLSKALFTGWGGGIQDDTLLEEAGKIIASNSRTSTPYNLTIITTDSHAPEGVISPRCNQAERSNGFKGAFHCSSRLVANFINDLKSKGLLSNTVVVIMGDHNFMGTAEQLKSFPDQRPVYFKIIDSESSRSPGRDVMTHFDVAPTLLDSLGILPEGPGKYGLGISVYSNMKIGEYLNHMEEVLSPSILNHSNTYDSFWLKRSKPVP